MQKPQQNDRLNLESRWQWFQIIAMGTLYGIFKANHVFARLVYSTLLLSNTVPRYFRTSQQTALKSSRCFSVSLNDIVGAEKPQVIVTSGIGRWRSVKITSITTWIVNNIKVLLIRRKYRLLWVYLSHNVVKVSTHQIICWQYIGVSRQMSKISSPVTFLVFS